MDGNHFLPVSKMISFFGRTVLDGYLVSPDFCHPLHLVQCLDERSRFYRDDYVSDGVSDCRLSLLNSLENGNVCSCVANSISSDCAKRIRIAIDAVLFSLIVAELKRSRTFRLNALVKFYGLCRKRFEGRGEDIEFVCSICDSTVWMVDTIVYLKLPKTGVIDYKWNKKLEILVNETCELENAMAWLSTLGGAFSALGDNYVDCADKAGLISMQQLTLALRIGDPITICRCRVYLSMSLLQKGYFNRARKMIRVLYKFSIGREGSKDFRLKNMCIAVWNRSKYLISERQKKVIQHDVDSR